MKTYLAALALPALLLGACGLTDQPTKPGAGPVAEFVIRGVTSAPDGSGYYFTVEALADRAETPVAAVREPGGSYYLPTMSRLPAFNHKVVRGHFAVDSTTGFPRRGRVFVVTALVRDTTVATVGR
jgi:hypothetical protein